MFTMDSIIDEKIIEACEAEDACEEGLSWLRKKPRSFADLKRLKPEWYRWLAAHKNYPATLELLAKDADADVRWSVAGNAATPPATLELLAKDADAYVRRSVAGNAATPPATLELLAKDA
ncbi:MAG TPA: hypothetical protein VGG42_18820, partial [Acidobacteriaceae bacterium]